MLRLFAVVPVLALVLTAGPAAADDKPKDDPQTLLQKKLSDLQGAIEYQRGQLEKLQAELKMQREALATTERHMGEAAQQMQRALEEYTAKMTDLTRQREAQHATVRRTQTEADLHAEQLKRSKKQFGELLDQARHQDTPKPTPSGDKKLDAILSRLEAMEKRLSDLEKQK